MARKIKCNGAGEGAIVRGAITGAPKPPPGVEISEQVQPYWETVTTAKAKRAWTANDLVLAADMARSMFRLEMVSRQVEILLPMCLIAPTPEEQRNIRALEVQADLLAKRIRLLSAHLQIHTEATQGKARDQVAQNKIHKDAKEFGEAQPKDSLIARPAH